MKLKFSEMLYNGVAKLLKQVTEENVDLRLFVTSGLKPTTQLVCKGSK